MRTKTLTFRNRKGLLLSAKLELPAEGGAKEFVLFAHCFTCGKDLVATRNISRALSAQGFGVLRFDFTGLGKSEGEFADSHFAANVEDLIDAAAYLAEDYTAPSVLVGHSLGGAAAILAGAQLESVRGVVTIGTPASPEHVLHIFQDALPQLEAKGQAEVNIAGRSFTVGSDFVEAVRGKSLDDVVRKWGKALLVFHSPQDDIVGIENAAQIYQAALHPKSFVSLDGADHLLSKAKDSLYVGNVIASWVDRYIDQEVEAPEEEGHVVVSLAEPGFTCKVKSGPHRLIADEPKRVGGLDMGPAPYEFVGIGLGACTAMTIRMYTERKGWKVDEVNVHVDHTTEKDPNPPAPGKKERPVNVFNRQIEILGDLDDEQRTRILEIADRCPVHRTLEHTSIIRTEKFSS
ncbi:MAG: OsmC family protein [bacterium]|nr:OsmC family protein [bacterium]